MRKTIMMGVLAATIILPAVSFADNNGPGCGIGTILFKGQSGLSSHTTAATTNGSTFNQLFGLTSGTLECDTESTVSNEYEQKVFVASNMDLLSQDMAMGGGIYLNVLAETFNISPEHRKNFYKLTQENYAMLLNSSNDGASAVISALKNTMKNDIVLKYYVN